MEKVTAWHFSNKEGTLGYNDGRKIVLGVTLSVPGKPKKCTYGLHGSVSILDALTYAPGCRLWKVEIWGDIDSDDDKLCGKHRTPIIDYGNVSLLVVKFAQFCSERAQTHADAYAADAAARAADAADAYAADAAARAADAADTAARAAAPINLIECAEKALSIS